MGWATVLLSGVVAGVVSALVSWIGGLHRDKRVAAVDAAYRREDVRRGRLADALVDFLAADRQRFDTHTTFVYSVHHLEKALDDDHTDHAAQRRLVAEAVAPLRSTRDVAEHAVQRLGLYSPTLYLLAVRVQAIGGFGPAPEPGLGGTLKADREAVGRRSLAYRDAVDGLLVAARTELGIVPPLG